MNENDIESAILLFHKEIAQAIFENEYMSKAHDDYNKERGKIATYDEIIDLISGHTVKSLKMGLNYGDQDTLMPAT